MVKHVHVIFLAIALIALVVSGCTTRQSVAARVLVGAGVGAAEKLNDRAMTKIDGAVLKLEKAQHAARKSRCRLPYMALVRYANRGAVEEQTVLVDCGLAMPEDTMSVVEE